MATTKDYRDFILEQLNLLDNITCRPMMGEYLLYYNDILFGGIYDERLLIKIVETNKKYNLKEQIPYQNAKPMYIIDDMYNKEKIKEIVIETCKVLPKKERKKKLKNNYFLIHGSFGSPYSNWFPYIRKELEKKVLEVYTPDFPTGVGYQNYINWSRLLKTYLDADLIGENTTIFAHSIAPVFICHFLTEYKIKVKKLVFVCGFNNYFGINDEYDAVNKTMYFNNLEDIKKYSKEIICFYSKNDPYVKYESEKEFADKIATKQIVIESGGHLNSESGYEEFSELLNYL